MKVVGINSSPREKGNTYLMMSRVMGHMEKKGISTEIIHIGGKDIKGCRACDTCRKLRNETCILDDGLNTLIPKLKEADGLILGAPTYYADVPAEMKAFIDRAGRVCGANGRLLNRKIGAAVIAVRRGGGIHAFDTINHFFLISGMIVPGSTYWNLGVGREIGEVLDDAEGMATMDHLAENFIWLLEKTGGGLGG
ncbi:MAG TPA: flavodoxin family protein [Candidatus Mcinerneyibacteriales bacterium]|jgi:multimeric flavodoxin WrbA|nr:flavodoxin family protein [Candidatus Mcinerneyibacteriales bacterium]HPJ69496.1 flavodoxin family protein [Candidatus Mcinerneyibacteriales bacterium]HPQ89257.1 flavodoxin family protein [Candidatus Mcinerneyibacteriales bacterium]